MRLMSTKARPWLWQLPDWPRFTFDVTRAATALAHAHERQGRIYGMAHAIGVSGLEDAVREVWTQEALSTAAIEGETLDLQVVRSSVLRRLGVDDGGPLQRHVEGLVDVLQDATRGHDKPLNLDRLCGWQSALFDGTAAHRRIAVGRLRDHAESMEIVSGPIGREVVHYIAPPSAKVPAGIKAFLKWFAATTPRPGKPPDMDSIARAAIAHLWFETIHPFEDGNGRVGRAIADMVLAQGDRSPVRLYSLSRQILAERSGYYDALAAAQHSTMDATGFVIWFAGAFGRACETSAGVILNSVQKSQFWTAHANQHINERQRRLLQRLLADGDGGFLGGLNVDKYLKIVKVSKATATRDLSKLVGQNMLHTSGQGKAVRYWANVPVWTHGRGQSDAVE